MSVYITKLKCSPVRVPLPVPVKAPQLEIRHRDYVLVEMSCNDGSRGIGFSYVGTSGARSTAYAFREFVVPVVLGSDPLQIDAIQQQLRFETRIQGRGGVVLNAISAMDIALWDRNARAHDLPLSKYINPSSLELVPAYSSGGYLTRDDTEYELKLEIETALEAGFKAVKIKCAFGDLRHDLDRVNEARALLGAENKLMLDAYNRWQDVESALPFVKGYMEVDPYWIEDPFEPDLIEEMKVLNDQLPTRLATGEFYFGIAPFRTMAAQGAVNVFQHEAPRCGGITEWLRVARLAESNGIEVSPCWFHDLHVHLVAATEAATFVEFFPTQSILNFGTLIDNPIVPENGMIAVPQEPGLGFAFKEAAIDQYALCSAEVAETDTPKMSHIREHSTNRL